jgi:hypothetical protein
MNQSVFISKKAELKTSVENFLPVKGALLSEALARSLGAKTYASLLARFQAGDTVDGSSFDPSVFIGYYAENADGEHAYATACSIASYLEGARVEISIDKRPLERQSDSQSVAYDVRMSVPDAMHKKVRFELPEFVTRSGDEPYRVDSSHEFRLEDTYTITRGRQGKSICSVALIDGKWEGTFYVYAPEHMHDDSRCMRALQAALFRAVIPNLRPGLSYYISRPDNYQRGAWRIEVYAGKNHWSEFGANDVGFAIPQLPKRHIIVKYPFLMDHQMGRLNDGYWCADMYSNGIDEDRNPTSLETVEAAILTSINAALNRAEATA